MSSGSVARLTFVKRSDSWHGGKFCGESKGIGVCDVCIFKLDVCGSCALAMLLDRYKT